jgi:hypothetical protein
VEDKVAAIESAQHSNRQLACSPAGTMRVSNNSDSQRSAKCLKLWQASLLDP